MRLTELDIVNQCLASMGETPVNAVDADHPYIAAALAKLSVASTQEQARGWWFNTDFVALRPDATTHFIYVPNDAINVNPNDAGNAVVIRGRRLYDRFQSTYAFAAPVQVELVRELALDELPALAGHVVAARAVLDFQSAFDGDADKYGKLGASYQQVLTVLRAEHIRQSKVNMFNNPDVVLQMRGIRPMTRWRHRRW